jgi:hypothetical protein
MRLQFEVVRGPVGSVGVDLEPVSTPAPDDPDRTSDSLELQPHEFWVIPEGNLARFLAVRF